MSIERFDGPESFTMAEEIRSKFGATNTTGSGGLRGAFWRQPGGEKSLPGASSNDVAGAKGSAERFAESAVSRKSSMEGQRNNGDRLVELAFDFGGLGTSLTQKR